MAGQDDELIYSDDYTRVVDYQSRQFTVGDLSLAAINGVQWNAVPPALTAAATWTAPTVVLLLLVGLSPWFAALVFPAPLIVVYTRTAKERIHGLTEREKRRLRRNFRTRQPTELLGLAADTEPKEFAWSVITYTPAR